MIDARVRSVRAIPSASGDVAFDLRGKKSGGVSGAVRERRRAPAVALVLCTSREPTTTLPLCHTSRLASVNPRGSCGLSVPLDVACSHEAHGGSAIIAGDASGRSA